MSRKQRKKSKVKKRRRPHAQPTGSEGANMSAELAEILDSMPSPVPEYPGACDDTVARPDRIKFEFGMFLQANSASQGKMRSLAKAYARGKLSFLPNVEDWAMEKFFWHGSPGESLHPLDAFLQASGEKFSSCGREQIRRWKEAELNVFEIGRTTRTTVEFRAWDLRRSRPVGQWFPAIDLSITGVNMYRRRQGDISLQWMAPWAPDLNLFCATGYGSLAPKKTAGGLWMAQLTADAELACSRWPWRMGAGAQREYSRKWARRDWHRWIAERMEFPLDALLLGKGTSEFATLEALSEDGITGGLAPGIYFNITRHGVPMVTGATSAWPLDLSSPSASVLEEYRSWRMDAGPPPQSHRPIGGNWE